MNKKTQQRIEKQMLLNSRPSRLSRDALPGGACPEPAEGLYPELSENPNSKFQTIEELIQNLKLAGMQKYYFFDN
jgi:hypothetical protein